MGEIPISEAMILRISLRHVSSLLPRLLAIAAAAALCGTTLLAQQRLAALPEK